MDNITKEQITGTGQIDSVWRKVIEARLRWFGYVWRTESRCNGLRMLNLKLPGLEKVEDHSKDSWMY